MAITINGARFLCHSRSRGLDLRQTTVVGRQGLFSPPTLVREVLARHGLTPAAADAAFFERDAAEWADPLFRALGARELEFLDVSNYEGATRLHDLNQPIAADWTESTDTLIDVGSLEHVFDVKTAVENYLRLVRVGGSVMLLDMPAVNLCGHGFYQFSPEFFCEVFSARHGFELVSLALAEDWAYAPFYTVTRPRDVRRRVEMVRDVPGHLFVHARKIAPFHGFKQAVVQSDYAEAWSRGTSAASPAVTSTGLLEPLRRAWRKLDPAGYWKFSTRRDKAPARRRLEAQRNPNLQPLEI